MVWAVGNYCLDAAERFRQIQCPTLALWGLEDVQEFEHLKLALATDRYFVSQAIPHAQVVALKQGTICMMNQMPAEIAIAVLRAHRSST